MMKWRNECNDATVEAFLKIKKWSLLGLLTIHWKKKCIFVFGIQKVFSNVRSFGQLEHLFFFIIITDERHRIKKKKGLLQLK